MSSTLTPSRIRVKREVCLPSLIKYCSPPSHLTFLKFFVSYLFLCFMELQDISLSTTSFCFLTLYVKLRYYTTYNWTMQWICVISDSKIIPKIEIGIRDWRETLLYLISDSFVLLLLNLSKIIHSFQFIVLIVHVIQCPENSGLRLDSQQQNTSNLKKLSILPGQTHIWCWFHLSGTF